MKKAKGSPQPFGAVVRGNRVNFAVQVPQGKSCELLLYRAGRTSPEQCFEMPEEEGIGEVRPEYGGGAIYVEFSCAEALISGCSFINNASPQNGQSLQVPFTNSLANFNLMECIFAEHVSGSVMCFDMFRNESQVPYQNSHIVSSCQFISNTVTGDHGLVQMK